MINEIFTITPIEAAIWHWAVSAQSYLATELFGSNVFLSIVIFTLTIFILKVFWGISQGDSADGAGTKIVVRLLALGLGLLFLRAINTSPFLPVDSNGVSWGSKSYVTSNPKYSGLKNSTDGLYWYTLFHKGSIQLEKFMTNTVNGIFQDPSYPKSPNMLFKVLVGSASVALDDPKVTESLDTLAQNCSDTANGKVVGKSDSLKVLFDLFTPECQDKYNELRASLSRWVTRRYPSYLAKFDQLGSGEFPNRLSQIKDRSLLENKVISSAILNFAKSKTGRVDGINSNVEALGIKGKEEHFWFTVQRMVSGGSMIPAILSPFTDKNVEAGLVKNEAGIIYNNLLNLVPTIKGYIKAFICLSFLIVSALLSMGFARPFMWWGQVLLLEAMYTPLSALNYQLCSFFLTSSDVISSFGDLRNDPLVISAANIIDSQLVRVQTAYFLTQTVICAMFVFGIIRAGFTVRQMSFSQGSGFSGFLTSFINSRALYSAGGGIGRARNWAAHSYRRWRGTEV